MTTITFDAHKFIKQLEVAGVPAVQAEAFVNAQRDILSEALDSLLATRSDRLAISSDLALLQTKISSKMTMLSWMLGIVIALEAASFAKHFF